MEPSLTAEEFAEGKSAPPKLVPVNAAAAEAKPKIQVAKRANILASLATGPTESPSRGGGGGDSSDAPARAAQQPPKQRAPQQQQPRLDDDMGIVRVAQPAADHSPRAPTATAAAHSQQRERSESPPNAMIPKRQVKGAFNSGRISLLLFYLHLCC